MNFDSLLVSTKFAPPRLSPRYIPRRKLLNHLRNAQRSTLTVVTGSAGFGKTVLLAQWRLELMKSGAVVAWLSLSRDDRQLSSFCTYLLAAFNRLGISVEDDMLMEGDNGKAIDSLVALVVNGAARVPEDLYLFIDDYHHVEDPWAHKLMQKLLDPCPDNLHLVLASRAAVPLNVARLRVLERVIEIGSDEMPFDLEETRVFLEQGLGALKLSADEVRLLHDLTSGWPASLQLLAIMLKSRPSTRLRLRDLGLRSSDLQAYLAEDVVANLPVELNEFMETISVCRRFNAELAESVTGSEQAAHLIRRAEEENLLIYRIESDDSSPWYRFHPLFGEFLSARLARRGQEAVKELHRRASQWFAGRDLLVEAVRHAIPAGDLEFAVEAIEHSAPTTWSLPTSARCCTSSSGCRRKPCSPIRSYSFSGA
jgi:LuxR family maltose regulon positive regulatory protein